MDREKNHALLLIDVQKGFLELSYWGARNNPDMELRISQLLAAFRTCDLPVIHVQHQSVETKSPLRPNQWGVEFMSFAKPIGLEPIFVKTVNSAFIGTSLDAFLRNQKITDLTMTGMTSDHCVSTSARMAANLGFNVTIAEDAVATFGRTGYDGSFYAADLVHDVALASLKNEFASVVSTEDLIRSIRKC
jgi:nicotinamidase-related amidase